MHFNIYIPQICMYQLSSAGIVKNRTMEMQQQQWKWQTLGTNVLFQAMKELSEHFIPFLRNRLADRFFLNRIPDYFNLKVNSAHFILDTEDCSVFDTEKRVSTNCISVTALSAIPCDSIHLKLKASHLARHLHLLCVAVKIKRK